MACAFKREGIQVCGSRYNLKLVEFRHPDYKDFNTEIELCETHFQIVFEEMIEEERKAYRSFDRESKNYQTMYKETKRVAEQGSGFFDHKEFHNNFYGKTSRAKTEWEIVRKFRCRLEYCSQNLKGIKSPYTIRVYPIKRTEYTNYFFCSRKHWEAIKLRIGIMKLDKSSDYKPITLDGFVGEAT